MTRILKVAAAASLAVVLLLALALGLRALPHSGPVRISLIGDSTVVGYTDNPEWTEPFAFGFRGRLAERLTSAGCEFEFVGSSPEPWNGKSGTPTVYNGLDLRQSGMDNHRGYGGINYSGIQRQLPFWLLADDPDVILFQAGINSIREGETRVPAAALRSLEIIKIEAAVFAPGADVIVAQIAPYAVPTPAIDHLNDHIAANFNSVDLHSLFLGAGGEPAPAMFSNGINHPTNVGYQQIADAWFAALLPVLQRREACPY